jgi:hypothetical protein
MTKRRPKAQTAVAPLASADMPLVLRQNKWARLFTVVALPLLLGMHILFGYLAYQSLARGIWLPGIGLALLTLLFFAAWMAATLHRY